MFFKIMFVFYLQDAILGVLPWDFRTSKNCISALKCVANLHPFLVESTSSSSLPTDKKQMKGRRFCQHVRVYGSYAWVQMCALINFPSSQLHKLLPLGTDERENKTDVSHIAWCTTLKCSGSSAMSVMEKHSWNKEAVI